MQTQNHTSNDPLTLNLTPPLAESHPPRPDMPAHWMAVDVETSGLDPWRHGVLSIGAEKVATRETFYAECRMEDAREIEAEALAVNGWTPERCRDKSLPSAREVMEQFLRWCGPAPHGARGWTLVGKNVGKHDYWFLKAMLAQPPTRWWQRLLAAATVPDFPTAWDFDRVISHQVEDIGTMALCCEVAGLFRPERRWSADAVFAACGLGREPKPHHGMTGAAMTANAAAFMHRSLRRLGEKDTNADDMDNPLFPDWKRSLSLARDHAGNLAAQIVQAMDGRLTLTDMDGVLRAEGAWKERIESWRKSRTGSGSAEPFRELEECIAFIHSAERAEVEARRSHPTEALP